MSHLRNKNEREIACNDIIAKLYMCDMYDVISEVNNNELMLKVNEFIESGEYVFIRIPFTKKRCFSLKLFPEKDKTCESKFTNI